MKSRVSIAGHPIHPMLVTIPIGLWIFSFVADLIYSGGGDAVWGAVAYFAMAGGIIGALAAAIPGVIELFSVTSGQTRRIGLLHMAINLIVVLLYAINLWMRTGMEGPTVGMILLSVIGVALLAISGWFGGEMVYRHGVGVEGYGRKTT